MELWQVPIYKEYRYAKGIVIVINLPKRCKNMYFQD